MLSKKAKHTIQTLMFLGKQPHGTLLSASQMAESQNIPKKSMESILFDLKNAEFVFSKKGSLGGYLLTRPLEDIYLVDIVRLVDGPIAQVTCASAYHYRRCEECVSEETCAIRQMYLDIRTADLKILSSTSIAHLIEKEKQLFVEPELSGY